MKPHVITHMTVSIDGRILPDRWQPKNALRDGLYDRLHDQLESNAWLVGRVTGQEFAKGDAYPASSEVFPRGPWIVRHDVPAYGIVLDASGKIAWSRADIGGDPILVVLAESVSDAHLAGLRADGVSYIFAGATEIDLALLLEILARDFGIARLLVEGGGGANGAFLRAGLLDEISLILCPAIDGGTGAPSLFDAAGDLPGRPFLLERMTLLSSERLEGDNVWLRYAVQAAAGRA